MRNRSKEWGVRFGFRVFTLIVWLAPILLLPIHSEGSTYAVGSAILKKQFDGLKKRHLEQFKNQKKRDRLISLDRNSFMNPGMRPLPGTIVLLTFRVETWEEQGPGGLGISPMGRSLIQFTTSVPAKLFPLIGEKSPMGVSATGSLETKCLADEGGVVGVWVQLPDSEERVTVVAKIVDSEWRTGFEDGKSLAVNISASRKGEDEPAHVAELLYRRGRAILDQPATLQWEDAPLPGKAPNRKILTLFGKKTVDVKAIGDGTNSDGDAISIPTAAIAGVVTDKNWHLTHSDGHGNWGIIRFPVGNYAVAEVWSDRDAEAGFSEQCFLYSAQGTFSVERQVQSDAIDLGGTKSFRNDRHERYLIKHAKFEGQNRGLRHRRTGSEKELRKAFEAGQP